MPTYYPVRFVSGVFEGTESGAGTITSISADTWANNFATTDCYPTIKDAVLQWVSDGATADDVILVAADHNATWTATSNTDLGTNTASSNNDFLKIISVSTTDVTQYQAGATEYQDSTTYEIYFNGPKRMRGVTYKTARSMFFEYGPAFISDCVFEVGTNRTFNVASYCRVFFSGCTFQWAATGTVNAFGFDIRTTANMVGCTIAGPSTLAGCLQIDGGDLIAEGCDFSALTSGVLDITRLYYETGSVIQFTNCKMPSGGDPIAGAVDSGDSPILVTCVGGGDASVDADHYFFVHMRGNECVDTDTVYRNGADTFATSGDIVSWKVDTTADEINEPFVIELPAKYILASTTAEDVISVYVATSSTLDKSKLWLEAVVVDETNNHDSIFVTSEGNAGDALDTYTASGDLAWTSPPSTPNYYEVKLDLSAVNVDDCVVVPRLHVMSPSVTVYVCPDWQVA